MDIMQEYCKYCGLATETVLANYIKCTKCKTNVHLKCLRKGSVPGGLCGDIFYRFTCETCSITSLEIFERDKMPWLQAIVLVLYHMQTRTPGLARKGFFHWKIHIATFINKYWNTLFNKDFKRKKKWMGTISGTLSHYSPHIFLSGTSLFNDQGWWTLAYPQLPPNITIQLNSEFLAVKQKYKEKKMLQSDQELFHKILNEKQVPEKFLIKTSITDINHINKPDLQLIDVEHKTKTEWESKSVAYEKSGDRVLLPSLEMLSEEPSKRLKSKHVKLNIQDDITAILVGNTPRLNDIPKEMASAEICNKQDFNFFNPFCHYNTSLSNLTNNMGIPIKIKLTGNITEDLILSPYSGLNLKPYIRRDSSTLPQWLQLMTEILVKTNQRRENWSLPPRHPIDYTYVQPSHIPAINSLCNEFFWPGIDLTECLQYPDFSCVVLYKKLIVGFAFLVPNVKFNECYLSFIFTRPSWTNIGIAKFMIYHLIQTSLGKDITLHVSINNPALFLYQQFGFKVESVALGFYDKYLKKDTRQSKHAFFCRLER